MPSCEPPLTCGSRIESGAVPRPGALDVALVGHEDRAALAAPLDDLAQVLERQDPTARVGRAVEPQQPRRARAERGQGVGGQAVGTGERSAHLVGRVGQGRIADQVTGADAEVHRHRADELLGADDRQHAVEAEAGDPVAAGQPVDRRATGGLEADRRGIARGVGGVAQGLLHDLGSRVDGRADREVDDAVGVRPRRRGVVGELVPGEVREAAGDRPGRHSSCSCGGSAATSAWSASMTPILAAPPGEPRSSKKWTLAS